MTKIKKAKAKAKAKVERQLSIGVNFTDGDKIKWQDYQVERVNRVIGKLLIIFNRK